MGEEFTIKDIIQDVRNDIKDLKDDNKIAHDKIVEQTTKHNGRMKKLEQWKAKITGALVVVNIMVVAVLIPLTIIFVQQYMNLDKKISITLEEALNKELNED